MCLSDFVTEKRTPNLYPHNCVEYKNSQNKTEKILLCWISYFKNYLQEKYIFTLLLLCIIYIWKRWFEARKACGLGNRDLGPEAHKPLADMKSWCFFGSYLLFLQKYRGLSTNMPFSIGTFCLSINPLSHICRLAPKSQHLFMLSRGLYRTKTEALLRLP